MAFASIFLFIAHRAFTRLNMPIGIARLILNSSIEPLSSNVS